MKKLKYIQNIVAGLFLLFATSCNSFLDVDPMELTEKTFYKSETELNSALTGVYAPLIFEDFYGNSFL